MSRDEPGFIGKLGTILGELNIDLPRPRQAEMRESVEFLEQVVETRHLIGLGSGAELLSEDPV